MSGDSKEATRLIFLADLSPSMYLKDAGKDGSQTRQERMKDVVDGILDRVSGNLRFGVIAFYTESLPVVMEARDPELVRKSSSMAFHFPTACGSGRRTSARR